VRDQAVIEKTPTAAADDASSHASQRSELPVSLVIPVRDEQATVEQLIASIDAQTARPAEVIFCRRRVGGRHRRHPASQG
jgi:cellulose synthase/poly-beta-1,6-N-acetylglucosamine synthase-like glycosyltransferase